MLHIIEQSDNPFALAADIFTEDAMEKIKKGLPNDMGQSASHRD